MHYGILFNALEYMEIQWFINIVIIHYHGITMFSYMHYCNNM